MSFRWTFKEAGPGDRARESQVEKFFNSDVVANRANAIVREGIQNSLDAASNDLIPRVRIARGCWSADETAQRLPRYMKGFEEHFDIEVVRAKINNPPMADEKFRYLLFEDFNTSGLKGNPAQWWPSSERPPNPFFNYFRAEGISDKTEGARGRHGVGRLVFMFASRVRCIFGLTQRDGEHGSEELLMGTCVLRNHSLGETPYLADGWFGALDTEQPGLILPLDGSNPLLAQFKEDFAVSRTSQNGLSVVVPWLSQEVTFGKIIEAVLAGYFYPILRERLVVEVAGESGESQTIDAQSIEQIVSAQPDAVAAKISPVIALAKASLTVTTPVALDVPAETGAPKWNSTNINEEARQAIHDRLESGEVAAIRVPIQVRHKDKTKPVEESHFDIFMQRDSASDDGEEQIQFIREGIIITDVRHRRVSGIRALVVIDEGALATFLGDSENPSHTQWQVELVRDKYSFHRATIDYVVQSVPSILTIISQQEKKPESSLLIDLFSIPSDDESDPKVKQKRPQKKDGGKSDGEDPEVNSRPRSFVIGKLSDGFVIRHGDPAAQRPSLLSIRAAYGVRRGSPFTKYNRADFQLGKGDIKFRTNGCQVVEHGDNRMVVKVIDDSFEITVTGFDTSHRDLHIDVRPKDDVTDGDSTSEVDHA